MTDLLLLDRMRPTWFWLSLFVPTLAVIWLAWGSDWPLGVPGEWTWSRLEMAGSIVLTVIPLAIVGACYLGFVWLGAGRIETCRPGERALWLGLAPLAGFMWLWVAQEAAPEGYQLSKAAWVLYFKGSSGYFTEARYEVHDLSDYLAHYEEKMAEGDVLHIGTHPPGLIVVIRGMLELCRKFPGLVNLLSATEPESVRRSFDQLERQSSIQLGREDLATLWLAGLVAHAMAALTVVGLFGLIRRTCSRAASWKAISFWPLVPAVAIFLPKSDAVFPCLGVAILWLWLQGMDRKSVAFGLAAGLAVWVGLFMSLAFLSVIFLAAAITVFELWQARRARSVSTSPVHESVGRFAPISHSRVVVPLIAAGCGFLLPSIVLWLGTGINLLAVWFQNYRNHAAFYAQFKRSYGPWLLVNPLEFAIAAGVPLAVLAVWSMVKTIRTGGVATSAAWGCLVTWGVLWLSGKNMGEAARLWLLVVPWLAWLAGPLFEQPAAPPATGQQTFGVSNPLWLTALGLQLAVQSALVMRVVGFHFQ